MIIDVPKIYNYSPNHDNGNYAYEKNGVLYIKGGVSFEDLMYNLVFTLQNQKRCFYCNRKLHHKIRSIDHKIPKFFGGVTIPQNMVISCKKCNEEKATMTAEQYIIFRNLPDNIKLENKKEFLLQNERTVSQRGFCIPDEWINYNIRSKIYVDVDLEKSYKGKRYRKIKKHYKRYKKLPNPIVISGNNILLDGYLVLMYAKNIQLKRVPIIQLENIIVL